jgi:hypothetical protein
LEEDWMPWRYARALIAAMLAILLTGTGSSRAQDVHLLPTRGDFVGAWVSKTADASIYATESGDAQKGSLVFEKTLLVIEPVEEAAFLVRCRMYEWADDYSTVLGPDYGIGVYDPTTGTLLLAGPSQGANPVKLLPGPVLQYLHSKALKDVSWVSLRYLWPIEDVAARQLEATLQEKQTEKTK